MIPISTNNIKLSTGGVFAEKPHRLIGLDILRISLAVLIYMFHSQMHFGYSYTSYLNSFVSVGAIAMTGFFLLSGYLLRFVYGSQDLMQKHNLLAFYFKRFLGIMPLYYVYAILFILIRGKESLVDNLLLFPIEALGLQTTFTSLFRFSHNGGSWFISCILLAHLICPFLQMVCKQLNARHKVALLLLLIFLDIWGAVISRRFNTAWTYDNPFYRIIEFSCGLLVADINMLLNNNILKIMRSKGMLFLSLIILIVGISLMRRHFLFNDYMLYNIIALPCFIFMLCALGTQRFPILEKLKWINYAGKISYAFFFVQFFAWMFGRWIVRFVGYEANWFRIFVSFIYCLIAAIVAYELIQKPIVKWVNDKVVNKILCKH